MRILRSRSARGVLAIAAITLVSRAEATVTQVDGTIVPVGTVMQSALDIYETPVGTLNAVKDAAETPQIFKPRLSSPVVFLDMQEGAGFENSFGWYNVGDDVSTTAGRLANLHPVMGCGVPMATSSNDPTIHIGNPAFYVRFAEPNTTGSATDPTVPNKTVSVDFNQERTAGRYKGGFIGFYLITPEDRANPGPTGLPGVTCGDFRAFVNVNNTVHGGFGFIYFTQKDLNNDGDFVHHLVYRSKTADRFMFGFEDLFRGGDNDYDDMAMQIDGLTPPCVPSAEVCDGLDNDCDGLVDANDPDLTGVGTTCTCDGSGGLACDNGPRFGQCLRGVTACTSGAITCHGTGAPSAEICDGVDNNCNREIDDNPTDATIGKPCDGGDSDGCPEGNIVCQAGALVCNDNTGPNAEICDGKDNNCNDQIDEGDPGGGGTCDPDTGRPATSVRGVCTVGVFHCTGGNLVCQGGVGPGTEVCNGLDDNCNGVTDNDAVDVGQPCGASDVGQCRLGRTTCDGGQLRCVGETGQTVEVCNGIDDDCNGTADDDVADAGQPCQTADHVCSPGVKVCVNGALECRGEVLGTPEICDGIDNDCDGIVDDNVTGEDVDCGDPMKGLCSIGKTKCIAGKMECVGGTSGGTEVCNGVDDDCDGTIDGKDLCGAGGVCDNGMCFAKCQGGEFPCPIGKLCNDKDFCVQDPCFGVTCPKDADGNLQTCRDGACVLLCSTTKPCDAGFVCRGSDGVCVRDTCEFLPKCAATEICVNAACVTNPCNGVTCGSDQFCRGGTCVGTCEGVTCDSGQTCRDGACVATGCKTDCGADEVCNPTTGACQRARCSGVVCRMSLACDPVNGGCIADPCEGVTCPGSQTCSMGQCGTAQRGTGGQGSGSGGGVLVTAGGGGGCSSGGDGSLGAGLAMLALAIARSFRRSLRRSLRGAGAGVLPATALAAALLAPGCKMNNYCLDCETSKGDGGTGGTGSDDGGNGGSGGGSGSDDGGQQVCDSNQIQPELCNHIDDNCDGQIDEGFDLQGDPLNCGKCGIQCNKRGAQTRCVAGACQITGCFAGFHDLDGDIVTKPYDQSNGCEWPEDGKELCFPSNGGVEVCDGIDNNCNGTADEGFDEIEKTDPNNCGACRHRCQFFKAVDTTCEDSKCKIITCQAGFIDLDRNPDNGCEYACTKTNSGDEICDLRDNDCNGTVDDGFEKTSDASNCGACGRVCQFPHATASCALGVCRFDPGFNCEPGFIDLNGIQVDGCEYQCTKTNGGAEICDGVDNDCDGVADEGLSNLGSCASTSPPTGACTANGTLTCAAGQRVCKDAIAPTPEICNNVDDNCDGAIDDDVIQSCYDGPDNTSGIGACHPGTSTCVAGAFGACAGQVTPATEQCNGVDDDCNGTVDDASGGGVIIAACYDGPGGTSGVGTCKSGAKTCTFGAFGACTGQIVPRANDVCGDGLDSDCDGKNDAAEGCQVLDAELRLDSGGGTEGEASAGLRHSYDIVLARGGNPLGTNVYAAWSQLDSSGTSTDVFFRRSVDGGKTWGNTVNVTDNPVTTLANVKPLLIVLPGTTDRIVVAYQTVLGGVRDMRVQVSTNGTSFGAQSAALDASGDSFHHVAAIATIGLQTLCVLAWEQLDTTTLNRDVMSRISVDGCATFPNPAFRVNNITGTTNRFAGRPQVGITSDGKIVWAWREQRVTASNPNPTRDVFASVAGPNVTATTTAPATDIAIDTDTAADADFPVLVVNETSAYLTWQDVATAANAGSDVMFTRSTTGGASWEAARIIDDPAAEVSASFTPTLAVDPRGAGTADDLVALAWEDRRQGSQVFAAVSGNGGATFATPTRASSESGAAIAGGTTIPQLAASGGMLTVTYQNQGTASTARPHIFVATSIDTGATWQFTEFHPDTGVGPALTPQIVPAVQSGKPAAVTGWTDFRANQTNGDIYIAVSH